MVAYISILVFMSVCIIATKMLERGKAAARDPTMSADEWLITSLDPRKSFDSVSQSVRSEVCTDGGSDNDAYDKMGLNGWDVFLAKFRVFLGLEKEACPNSNTGPLWLWVIAPVLGIGLLLFAATILEGGGNKQTSFTDNRRFI